MNNLILNLEFQGCYKENLRRRYFSRNPGDFDPGALTPTICAAKCGSFSFPYAAIAEGRSNTAVRFGMISRESQLIDSK